MLDTHYKWNKGFPPPCGSVLERQSVTVRYPMKSTLDTSQQYLTITNAVQFCGVSTKTFRRADRSRQLTFFKPARAFLFALKDLDA